MTKRKLNLYCWIALPVLITGVILIIFNTAHVGHIYAGYLTLKNSNDEDDDTKETIFVVTDDDDGWINHVSSVEYWQNQHWYYATCKFEYHDSYLLLDGFDFSALTSVYTKAQMQSGSQSLLSYLLKLLF